MSFSQKAWRLSPMYFFFFSMFGLCVPYLTRYLTENGLTAKESSIVFATFFGVNVFAPFMFSYLADRTGRRMLFLRISFLLMAAFYLLAYFGSGFWFYVVVFGLFGTFLASALPLMESVTVSTLGAQKGRYGQVRLWGSIGFLITVWLIGSLIDLYSVRILPLIGVAAIVIMFFSTFFIPERPKVKSTQQQPTASEIPFGVDWTQVVVLLAVILFWQFSMAPYNAYFDLYMRNNGFSATVIGFLISFGTLCEIGIFIYISKLLHHFSHKVLMAFALAVTVVRWLVLYSFPEYFAAIFVSQACHAVTYGLVHAVAVNRIAILFPESRSSFAQGLYVSIGTGVGLFIGNLLAGYFWNGAGDVFLMGAMWVALALVITWFGFKQPKQTS